ncbi:MAG: ATP-binding domain-containing protein [Gammaproteobacteria bacterium]|nr:ATP-binding domain-containing protein [Gammaproteobacteria bacterium]
MLHSLGLARRGEKPFGEIDFVALIPGSGVVCLEVKGGGVRCQDGMWYTRDRYGREHRLSRSPIAQVRDAVFGLRSAVRQQFGNWSELASLLYSSAVVLPDVSRFPDSPDHDSEEVIDVDALREPISRSIMTAVANDARRLKKTKQMRLATPKNLRLLRNYLRPNFDVALARSTVIRRSEERIVQLTEEQYDALDLLERNPRCVVEGAAGTGKTLLALELARRVVSDVNKILLVCYNRLLGEWLSQRVGEICPERTVAAGSYHRHMKDLILSSAVAEEFREAERSAGQNSEDLFDLVYPLYGQLALSESLGLWDLCIMDEAQDLVTEPVLDVIDEGLTGGLREGRWVMLGDFNRQAIYSRSHDDWGETLSKYVAPGRYTIAPLTRNCRNTYRIGEETALLSGFDTLPYRLDDSDCLPVDYRYWRNRKHQVSRLREVLEALARDGVPLVDIVVLSPRKFENSVASELGQRITPVDHLGKKRDRIAFSTIHAFKGLESPVTVVCDVEEIEGDRNRSLLYVGMSRARSYLIVLLHERLKGTAAEAMDRRLRGPFG